MSINIKSMSKIKKHWSEKTCDEMEYGEFVRWAREYIVDEFLKGGIKEMTHAIETVVSQTINNTKFGGSKPLKRKR